MGCSVVLLLIASINRCCRNGTLNLAYFAKLSSEINFINEHCRPHLLYSVMISVLVYLFRHLCDKEASTYMLLQMPACAPAQINSAAAMANGAAEASTALATEVALTHLAVYHKVTPRFPAKRLLQCLVS
eukprot:4853165-Pleurochrysis_carterae.AAC.8